jgi:hypothetical protein
VRSPKKFNVRLCQKMPFVLACFEASAAPRREKSDKGEKDALFRLHTQITVTSLSFLLFKIFSLVAFLATKFTFQVIKYSFFC